MGGISFEVHQPGADLRAAFQAARHAAAHEHGWREDSGTVATKSQVIVVHRHTLTLEGAKVLADHLLNQIDAPYCDHFGTVAAAIAIADRAGGPVTGWLFFGYANE